MRSLTRLETPKGRLVFKNRLRREMSHRRMEA